jgi:hypothetical protein
MNNLDRNTRTLIVCFLIAVFALIPLRFIEVGQMQDQYMMQRQVLGEKTEEIINQPIQEVSGLEAPYDQLERCFGQEEIETMENEIYVSYEEGNLSEEEVETLLNEVGKKKNNICQ